MLFFVLNGRCVDRDVFGFGVFFRSCDVSVVSVIDVLYIDERFRDYFLIL